MDKQSIGILGATSLVGTCILNQLVSDHYTIVAFSRKPIQQKHPQISWQQLNTADVIHHHNKLTLWICAAPIWTLPEHFPLLLTYGAQRIVILSSTSRFGKAKSSDPGELATVKQLTDAEETIMTWSTQHKIEWIILRPTLIYGLGNDKNITEIVRFIVRFNFFPLLGSAQGLRQPIHAQDVSTACILALNTLNIKNRTYNLTGGETLTYREMIQRIFLALNKTPRFVNIPRWLFLLTISVLNKLPRYQHWTTAMAERMNQDLVFDNFDIQQDLRFSPGRFILSAKDLPSIKRRT